MPLLTDFVQLKTLVEIPFDDTSEDAKLLLLMQYATDWISELLARPGLFYKSRTEIYSGTGTQKLTLRSRPVYTNPEIQVFADNQAYWGAGTNAWQNQGDQLKWGSDFALQVDQEDGTSRSGILVRLNSYWRKNWQRATGYLSPFLAPDTGSYKITYTAGYTIDNLPTQLRLACNLLVMKMRYLMPVGMPLSSENYEERSISILGEGKDYLLSEVKDMILGFRNYSW